MINYIYYFEDHNIIINTSTILNNEIWVDVGNTISQGCFDCHQTREYTSTLSLVTKNISLIDALKRNLSNKGDLFIHTHKEPDIDSICSIYAIKYYLEHSVEEFKIVFGERGLAAGLIDFVNDIVQGKGKNVNTLNFYTVFSSLDEGMEHSDETDLHVLKRGEKLISIVIDAIKKTPDIDLHTFDISEILTDEFNSIRIKNDRTRYLQDKKNNNIVFENIPVWTKKGTLKETPAAIWKTLPESYIGYIYAREDGYPLTIVPYSIKGENNNTTRVYISIDPEYGGCEQLSLKPFAELIEQMEQIQEQSLFETTHIYRRDRSRIRKDIEHFGKAPFSVTFDPWYLNNNEDLIVSPRCESIQSYNDIIDVLRHNGTVVYYSRFIEYSCSPNKKLKQEHFNELSISAWESKMQSCIEKSDNYSLNYLIAELDCSLVRHGNKILETLCANISGSSLGNTFSEYCFFIDYSTCIYADLKNIIVLYARLDQESFKNKYSNQNSKLQSSIFGNDSIDRYVEKIWRQRVHLINIGETITNAVGNYFLSEKIYRDWITFSAEVQKDDIIENSRDREIYFFLKKRFGINELKDNIMNECNLVVNESRNQLVYRFNLLSALAVPFILIATLFQMGILKFEEVIKLTGKNAEAGWVTIILIIIVFILLLLKKPKK